MKRRYQNYLTLFPVMFGAAVIFLVAGALLRAGPTTQSLPASEPAPAGTRPAEALEPQPAISPTTQAPPALVPTTQTQALPVLPPATQAQGPPAFPRANSTQPGAASMSQTQPARLAAAQTQPLRGQPPAQAPEEPGNTAGAEAQPSVWDLYKKGGYFMYPLTACSILAIALIIERFFALRRSAVIPRAFLPGLHAAAPDLRNHRDAALRYCKAKDLPIARMLAAGIRRLPRGIDAAEKAIEDAGANEALKLRRNMRFLYALGSVGTLLGLIGTISGMIKAFQVAASSGTGAANVHNLSTGIYEAMVNTFAGLAVAIIVTIFYYFFAGRIERLISEMNDALARFSDEFGIE